MGRKVAKLDDPTDAAQVVQFVEDVADFSQYKLLQEFIAQNPGLQRASPHLTTRDTSEVLHLLTSRISQKAAVAVHVYGRVVEIPCQHCRGERGPFIDCVILDGNEQLTKQCCSNCLWEGNTRRQARGGPCSFAKETRRAPCARQLPPSSAKTTSMLKLPTRAEETQSIYTKSTSGDTDNTHILGNLYLKDLHNEDQDLQRVVLALLGGLQQLHRRDMKAIKKEIIDVAQNFEDFQRSEVDAWETLNGIGAPKKLLVKPSGTLTSRIAHRLNQPSFTTATPENGSTADKTNACISMVMGTAFPPETLIYDQILRRDTESHGVTRYPEQIREVHSKFVRQIFENSEAKVEVIYGTKAFQTILADISMRITPFPLWGDYSGIVVFLVSEDCCQNAQMDFVFRKVLVPAYHPQHMFYASAGSSALDRQERTIAAAAFMAGVEHIPNYYRDRLWAFLRPSSHQLYFETTCARENARAISAACNAVWKHQIMQHVHEASLDYEGNTQRQSIPDNSSDLTIGWQDTFAEKPHSNKGLVELLPRAIEAANNHDQEWCHPSDFPAPVREWWNGQKSILFYDHDATISGTLDVVTVLQNCEKYQMTIAAQAYLERTVDFKSLRQVIIRLMELQQISLRYRKQLPQNLVHVAHDRFDGRGLKVCCHHCAAEMGEIGRPIFSVNRPNHYIRCARLPCPNCKKRSEVVSMAGESITRGVAHVQGPKTRPRAEYESMLLPQELRSKAQTEPVPLVCIGCQSKLDSGEDSYIVVDMEPRWTLGGERPLYLEYRPRCPHCDYHGRFVPKDPAIPSIHGKPLSKLAASYGAYDRCIIAKLMDSWPPSSRIFKGKTLKRSAPHMDRLSSK